MTIPRSSLLLLGFLTTHGLHAQISGSLTPPPGPPVSVMRTLEHIESRIPLVAGAPGVTVAPSGTITIAAPGSYFLAADLVVTGGSGVVINSDRVSLDLRGFAISSLAGTAAGDGIDINGSHISISDGHVVSGTTYDSGAAGDPYTGGGFLNGIYASAATGHIHLRLRDLNVSGCDQHGIYCADRSTSIVESCVVSTVGGTGIHAGLVRHSIASVCGGRGIFAENVDGCRGTSNGSDGIFGGSVANSFGSSLASDPAADGIQSSFSVSNCFGQSFGGDGIYCDFNVTNSVGQSKFSSDPGSDGIDAKGTVTSSYGKSFLGGAGIRGRTVVNSEGVSTGPLGSGTRKGIDASIVQGCHGTSSNDRGINAANVVNSHGVSTSDSEDGITSSILVRDSWGRSVGGSGIWSRNVSHSHGSTGTVEVSGSNGIFASYSVENSTGISWNGDSGLSACNVTNSHGQALASHPGAHGIEARGSVSGSTGGAWGGDGIVAQSVIASRGGSLARVGIRSEVIDSSTGAGISDGMVAEVVQNSTATGEVNGVSANHILNTMGIGAINGIITPTIPDPDRAAGTVLNSSGVQTDPSTSGEGHGIIAHAIQNSSGRALSDNSYALQGAVIVNSAGLGTEPGKGLFGAVLGLSWSNNSSCLGLVGLGNSLGDSSLLEIGIGNSFPHGSSEIITHKYLAP